MTLINALTEQLNGSFEMENENGARALVRFPLPPGE